MPAKQQKKKAPKRMEKKPRSTARAGVVFLEEVREGLRSFIAEAEGVYPELLLESLRAIISSLEEKDNYTHGHSIRVAEYATLLGESLGFNDLQQRELELAAILHDIGKIGIPDAVLLKPGRLTKAEFEIMKSHPTRSARILEKISALQNIIPGIKYHHERWDGLGYPEGLAGDDIPMIARIVLIADTYDAMTSTRPYRLALTKEMAFEELRRCAGTQFDKNLVEVFIKAVEGRGNGEKSAKRKSVTRRIA